MEQGELIGSQTSNQLIKKTTNGLEKFKKMSKNTPSSTVAAIDPVRELGMAIEKTNLKIGKRKSSGKKSKIRYSGKQENVCILELCPRSTRSATNPKFICDYGFLIFTIGNGILKCKIPAVIHCYSRVGHVFIAT